jgi:hypothetical protein
MSKIIVFLGIILFTVSGCSNLTTEDIESEDLKISNMQSGIGAIDDTETFDKQKFSYDITLSNKDKTEIKSESINIVFTEWIKQNQLENKVTDIVFDTESIIIKGYVNFDTKGLSKKEIISQQPFIDGVSVETDAGDKIFIKSQFH